jgi:hypothetical protein
MVSFAKLLRIMQGIEKKYKNIGLEKISIVHFSIFKICRDFRQVKNYKPQSPNFFLLGFRN